MSGVNVLGNKRLFFDDGFFSGNTPEAFYWAGFIAADGCVYYNKSGTGCLALGLASKDRGHIVKFASALGFTGKISDKVQKAGYKPGSLTSSMSLCSNAIVSDLARFGVVPNKTTTYAMPHDLKSHQYVNHFMRGYFDGDGTAHYSSTKPGLRKKLSFSMIGTYTFVESYRDILRSKLGLSAVKIEADKSIFRVGYCGNKNAVKIRDFLYSGANESIWLGRKHDILYNDWIDNKPRSSRCRAVVSVAENGLASYFDAITDAEHQGFDRSCIFDCLAGRSKRYKGLTWRYATDEDKAKYSGLAAL
jgi:hypothetical protein